MLKLKVDISAYIHTYEAFRIPKGSDLSKIENSDLIESDEQLVLTDASRNQIIQDRLDYSAAMKAKQDAVYAEQESEALKKYAADQAKMIAIYKSMSEGNIVSDTDEKKLMEYDAKLYQTAKMAQMMKEREKKKEESYFDDNEENEYEKKLVQFRKESEEMIMDMDSEYKDFLDAQRDSIVEVEMGSINISNIKSFEKLGGGLTGAIFDILI